MGTGGAHNPTLTAQALAWRTVEHLAANWRAIAGVSIVAGQEAGSRQALGGNWQRLHAFATTSFAAPAQP
jgi:hypothetical protein